MKREMKLPGWLFGFLCVVSMATATWAQGLEETPRPTMLWVTGRAVRDPMRKAPDYDSSYEASGPAILLTGDGLLLMSTQKLGNLTVPWRLKTSGLSGKSHTVHLVAYDAGVGLAFLRIDGWEKIENYTLNWRTSNPEVGELVSVQAQLNANHTVPPVQSFARIAGRSPKPRGGLLMDRDFSRLRGMPVQSERGELMGLVGDSNQGFTELVSKEELDSLLERLSRTEHTARATTFRRQP